MTEWEARGRLPGEPVAIVDIGSNSVRLVAYESLTRAPTPTFNEKVLCGLGRGVAMSGILPEDSVGKALSALQRFRILCQIMEIRDVRALATAAVRDAANGPQFLERAERAIGAPIVLLSGGREAQLSALGVVSSIRDPDGVVGDLGGGSLELTDVRQGQIGGGVTLPLGGLSLMDVSERSPKKAAKIARDALYKVTALESLAGRTFYAVGGTWRMCRRASANIPCTSCTITSSRPATPSSSPNWSNGSRPTPCPRSRAYRRRADRYWPTAPQCWRRSSVRPIRARS